MDDLKVYRAGRYVPVNAGIKMHDPQLLAVAFSEEDAQQSVDFFEAVVGAAVLEKVDPAQFGDLIREGGRLSRGVYVIGETQGRRESYRYRSAAVRPAFYAMASRG